MSPKKELTQQQELVEIIKEWCSLIDKHCVMCGLCDEGIEHLAQHLVEQWNLPTSKN